MSSPGFACWPSAGSKSAHPKYRGTAETTFSKIPTASSSRQRRPRQPPDVEGDREAFEILAWALEPGDAVYFHMLTLHAAGGATRRRRALSVRFLGDDVTHAPRPWKTSPDFPGLADELPAGAPMEHPLFPVVWEGP